MKYAAILEVYVEHTFYEDRRSCDFTVEPTADTARLLLGHRCLFRPDGDGFRVITSLDQQGRALLPLPDGVTLTFRLKLHNPSFALFTDLSELDAILAGGGTPVFTNAVHQGELEMLPGKRVPAFAEIAIVLGPAAGTGAPPRATFWVAFKARQAFWAYYCVTDLSLADIADKPLEIVDGADVDPIAFDVELRPADAVAAELAKLHPSKRLVRFLSTQPVTCHETPKKELTLLLGGDALLDSLPNPSPHRFSEADLAAPPAPQRAYCLFQIVKYTGKPWPIP